MTPEELKELSEDELIELETAVGLEKERRYILESAAERAESVLKSVYDAMGGDDREYHTPTGAHDAYPFDAIVNFKGKRYKSAIQGNVWSPAEYSRGWIEIDGEGNEPSREVSEWAQPEGAHDAYRMGDLVTMGNKTYRSKNHANVWSPETYPDGWEIFEPENNPATPDVPEWVAPTGGHDAYNLGNKIVFKGKTYESIVDGNVWSPEVYPNGWREV